MASRREYEMLFALNARMNGGFSGTFSKAQQEFTKLGKEIQGLHKVQGDINSYQKQQQAVEATRSRLESLQRQHDLLQREIGETSGSTSGLERENVRLEQRIRDTEAALERQNARLQATGARLEEAQVNTGDLTGESARLAGQLEELRARQETVAQSAQNMGQAHEEAAEEAQGFGDQSAQAVNAVQEALAAAGIAAALKEIAEAWMDCVTVAAEFQEGMSGVQAVSGATQEELDLLSAKAKEMGATTKFTAKEASDAMSYMAMAGWKTNDMLGGLAGIMNLAAASGEDLAQTSDIVTDALTAFGLQAADSGHFADILAVASSNANTNVSMMGETFKYVAPVAGALGYSAEDAAVSIGLMANSGIKASQAGTNLQNIFTRLSTDAGASSTQLGALGVLTEKLGVAFYNADGTTREWNAVLADSREAWAGLTEEQQVNYAKTIAGQRAIAGWLALMNAADADVQKLTASVDHCSGAAQRMAKVRLDNLNGQLTLMNSAADALKTTIGEQFTPELRGLAEVGTDVLTGLDKFVQENPGVVKGVAAGAAVIGTVTAALTAYTAGTKLAAAASALLASSIPGVNVILGVTAAVAGVAGVVTALATAANEGVPSVKELTEAAQDMQDAMDEAGAAHEAAAVQTLATAEAAGMYIDKLEELEAAQGENARESQEYQNVLALLLRTVPELSGCIRETTDEYGRSTYALEGSTEALRQNTEEWKKNAEAKAYQEYMNALYDEYGTVMQEAAANSIKLTQAQIQLEDLEKKRSAALERMNELDSKTVAWTEKERAEYARLQDSLLVYNNEMFDAYDAINVYTQAVEEDNAVLANAESGIESAQTAFERLTGATEASAEASAGTTAQTQELQGAISTTMEAVQALTDAYYEAYDAALESVGGQYALWDEAAKVAETSVGDINAALESQAKYWQDYNANLESLADRAGEIEGLDTVIASFADGSAESVNAVAGMASATDEELKTMVDNWKEVQREQEATAGSLAEMQTNMTAVMDQWGAALAEDIEGMDLSSEAYNAGLATVQGYIDAASEMQPQVRTAYANIAHAAVGAMAVAASSPGGGTSERGYATGTENAQPGWAWVGENGPELMFFGGGEKILNAAQSSALQAEPAVSAISAVPAAGVGNGSGGSPSISLVVQVQGNASQETVEDLSTKAQDIVDMVLDALDERAEDEKRCSMR